MTKEEYLKLLNNLEVNHLENKLKLAKEFAISNNPYKIGDKIKDHFQYGQIESIRTIQFSMSNNIPQCIYRCIPLNKNGSPKKTITKIEIYQSNIKL